MERRRGGLGRRLLCSVAQHAVPLCFSTAPAPSLSYQPLCCALCISIDHCAHALVACQLPWCWHALRAVHHILHASNATGTSARMLRQPVQNRTQARAEPHTWPSQQMCYRTHTPTHMRMRTRLRCPCCCTLRACLPPALSRRLGPRASAAQPAPRRPRPLTRCCRP